MFALSACRSFGNFRLVCIHSKDVCNSSRLPDGIGYGPPFGLGANQLWPKVTIGCGFLVETVGTYVLVLTILNAAVHEKSTASNAAPVAIGWAVLIVHLVLVPLTGCGINPARSFGPLVVDSMGGLNKWTRGWWIFLIAPFFGSLFATLTAQLMFQVNSATGDEKKKDEGSELRGDVLVSPDLSGAEKCINDKLEAVKDDDFVSDDGTLKESA